MNLKKVVNDLFANAKALTSEDDCAEAIVIPVLKALGHSDLARKVTIPVPSGEKTIFRQADIVARVKKQPRMVVETKRLTHKLDDEDASQALAYAELLSCRYALLTNGRDWQVFDRVSDTTGGLTDIPDAATLDTTAAFEPEQKDARQRLAARLSDGECSRH